MILVYLKQRSAVAAKQKYMQGSAGRAVTNIWLRQHNKNTCGASSQKYMVGKETKIYGRGMPRVLFLRARYPQTFAAAMASNGGVRGIRSANGRRMPTSIDAFGKYKNITFQN